MHRHHPHHKARLTPSEALALRALRPAMDAAAARVRRDLTALLRSRRATPAMIRKLPWDAARQDVVAAWIPLAARAGVHAARSARVVKEITDDEADKLGSRWAIEAARHMGDRVTLTTERGLLEILAQAEERGWDDSTTASALVDWAGVTPTNAKTLATQYDLLLERGAGPEQIRRALSRRAGSMIGDRAREIAINESNAAESGAYVSTWERMLGKGDIGKGSTMEIQVSDPCKYCQAIAANGPVPIGGDFVGPDGKRHKAPPFHSRCRCRPLLVPVALA